MPKHVVKLQFYKRFETLRWLKDNGRPWDLRAEL
jgi:hypothetical protein